MPSEGARKDHLERKLAAILAADIARYSALMEANEEATVRDLKAHQAVVLPLIAKQGVIDMRKPSPRGPRRSAAPTSGVFALAQEIRAILISAVPVLVALQQPLWFGMLQSHKQWQP